MKYENSSKKSAFYVNHKIQNESTHVLVRKLPFTHF